MALTGSTIIALVISVTAGLAGAVIEAHAAGRDPVVGDDVRTRKMTIVDKDNAARCVISTDPSGNPVFCMFPKKHGEPGLIITMNDGLYSGILISGIHGSSVSITMDAKGGPSITLQDAHYKAKSIEP